MNKNVQLTVGTVVLLAIGVVIYLMPAADTNTTTEQTATNTRKIKTEPQGKAEPTTNSTATAPAANKNQPPIQVPKNSTTKYSCKENKSFSVNYSFANVASTTITLSEGIDTRTVSVKPKIGGKDPIMQSENGKIEFVNKGNYALITENGKVTFDNCTLKAE